MKRNEIIDSWKQAEQELGIEIDPEFTVRLGEKSKAFLLIKSFGGPKGTIATDIQDTSDFNELGEMGFYCSTLSDAYATYDRDLFIDTLNDWGFFGGINRRPVWYTGQSWTHR